MFIPWGFLLQSCHDIIICLLIFQNADLTNANLENAILEGANLKVNVMFSIAFSVLERECNAKDFCIIRVGTVRIEGIRLI
jgi:hypothetical protein